MASTALISLFAFVPALAQPLLRNPLLGRGPHNPAIAIYGGAAMPGFAPQFNPKFAKQVEDSWDSGAVSSSLVAPGGLSAEQQAFMERQRAAKSGASSSAIAAGAPAVPAGTGGFSAEQLAFMERQRAVTGGASASAFWDTAPAVPAQSGASSSTFTSAYFPAYAPSYADGPQVLQQEDHTQASPTVFSILAAAFFGALVGVSGATFMMRFRRSTSISFKEPLTTVSN